LHQRVEGDAQAYGSTNLWSFDLLEVGGPLPCNNIRTFLHYLCSGGTREVSIAPRTDAHRTTTTSPAVEVVLRGPRADDGEVLSVSYLLRREEIHGDGEEHEGLEVWEKRLLVERIMALRSPTPNNNPWRLAIRAFAGVLKSPYAS
jgi:hypothetical protein